MPLAATPEQLTGLFAKFGGDGMNMPLPVSAPLQVYVKTEVYVANRRQCRIGSPHVPSYLRFEAWKTSFRFRSDWSPAV